MTLIKKPTYLVFPEFGVTVDVGKWEFLHSTRDFTSVSSLVTFGSMWVSEIHSYLEFPTSVEIYVEDEEMFVVDFTKSISFQCDIPYENDWKTPRVEHGV